MNEYNATLEQSKYDDCSDVISEVRVMQMQTRCIAAIERASGRKSVYYEQVTSVQQTNDHLWGQLAHQIGVVDSLLHNIRKGYLRSLEEIIHGEVFGDFLEMANFLIKSGYKDAAAVIAGCTLEVHLKKLCNKSGIVLNHGGKPKKADTLNSELSSTGIYSKLDQKNVTAWLGLRNEAAHGNYSSYNKSQVELLISGIRDFVTRNPA